MSRRIETGGGDAGRCGDRPYCLNLKDRDDFIVRKGLWAEFVGSLPKSVKEGGVDAGLTIRNPAPDGTPPSMPTGRNATLTIQYGGGDAGERARKHASAVLYRVIEHHLAKTGEWAEEDIEALRAGLAMLDSREADLRSSHREGAEAMREAAARVADAPAQDSRADVAGTAKYIRDAIRALPILGKTDAG